MDPARLMLPFVTVCGPAAVVKPEPAHIRCGLTSELTVADMPCLLSRFWLVVCVWNALVPRVGFVALDDTSIFSSDHP